MRRYYFHVYGAELLRDPTGEDLPGLDAAMEVARRSASELIAEQILRGEMVNLGQRIEIEDEDDGIVTTLYFRDFFQNDLTDADSVKHMFANSKPS